ncbi:MAG: hypothetical protein ACRD22_03900 [Terriglobia bacterium]
MELEIGIGGHVNNAVYRLKARAGQFAAGEIDAEQRGIARLQVSLVTIVRCRSTVAVAAEEKCPEPEDRSVCAGAKLQPWGSTTAACVEKRMMQDEECCVGGVRNVKQAIKELGMGLSWSVAAWNLHSRIVRSAASVRECTPQIASIRSMEPVRPTTTRNTRLTDANPAPATLLNG